MRNAMISVGPTRTGVLETSGGCPGAQRAWARRVQRAIRDTGEDV
jgi:hypothetical protein